MSVSFQSNQQNGRWQSGKKMTCCHQGTDYLCTLSFKTGLLVARSCYNMNGSPRRLKAFPFLYHPWGQLHDCLRLFTQQRGKRRGSCWRDRRQVALFTAVWASYLPCFLQTNKQLEWLKLDVFMLIHVSVILDDTEESINCLKSNSDCEMMERDKK